MKYSSFVPTTSMSDRQISVKADFAEKIVLKEKIAIHVKIVINL